MIPVAAIAERYKGAVIDQVFTDPVLIIHTETVEGLGDYELRLGKPQKAVGSKAPRWHVEIRATRPDKTVETLSKGKANAPWNVMHEVVEEALRFMGQIIEEQRGVMITGRRQSMRAV